MAGRGIALGVDVPGQDHLERFQLRRGERSLGKVAPILERTRPEFGDEVDRLTEDPMEGAGGELHHRVVGIDEAGGTLELAEEAFALEMKSAELPPLEPDQEPRRHGEGDADQQHDDGLGAGMPDQVEGRAGERAAGLGQ